MIDFATVAPAIKVVVETLAGTAVDWSRRPASFTDPTTQVDVTLTITSVGVIGGRDETRYTYDSDADTYTPKRHGQRLLNLQIKVESFDDTDDLWCWQVAENIRSGLDTESSRSTLAESCVVVVTVAGEILRFEIRRDNRHISACIISAVFAAPLSDSNTTPINFIETIDLTSHVSNASGTEVEGNFADEVMP